LGRFDWNLRSLAPRYRIAALASFALAYAALNIVGYELRIQHTSLVIIWPAAGLLLVALFLTPPRTWISLVALQLSLAVLIDYLLAQQWRFGWSVLFATADSLDAIVGATLAIRLIRQPAQPRIRQVIAFFGAAGLGAAASAVIGAFCGPGFTETLGLAVSPITGPALCEASFMCCISCIILSLASWLARVASCMACMAR